MWDKIKVLVLLLAVVGLGLYFYADRQNTTVYELFVPTYPVVQIGDVPLRVDIATTSTQRTQGLSNRESLDPVEGLLFVFDTNDYHGVWMKDMRFPIDVIWVSEDLEVVGITEGLLPDSYPEVFKPPEPVRYAIETARYFAESFGIEIGDRVEIPKKYRK